MNACDDLSIVLQYLAEGILQVWGGDAPPRINALEQDGAQGLYRLGLDMLSGHLACTGQPIPVTWHDWLILFGQPLERWWPGSLPDDADRQIPLLLDARPAEWVADFLLGRRPLPNSGKPNVSLWYYHAEVQQQEVIALMEWCRLHQPAAYSLVRAFLIKHPVTTEAQLREFIYQDPATFLLPPDLLFNFYENVTDTCLHDGEYWRCPHCKGLLRWFWDAPRCVRHSVCARLSNQYKHRVPIPKAQATLRLKTGIHWRVCVPGIPELELYERLKTLQTQGQLQSVELWPGTDQYDLRITFDTGEVWAVDVKDISNPYHLHQQLEKERSFLKAGDLHWSRGFFVIPQYRCEWSPDYVTRASPTNFWAEVQSVKTFWDLLKAKIAN